MHPVTHEDTLLATDYWPLATVFNDRLSRAEGYRRGDSFDSNSPNCQASPPLTHLQAECRATGGTPCIQVCPFFLHEAHTDAG